MKGKDFRLSVVKHKLSYQPLLENETYFYRSLKDTKINKKINSTHISKRVERNNKSMPNIIVDTFYMNIGVKHSIMFVSLSLANLP